MTKSINALVEAAFDNPTPTALATAVKAVSAALTAVTTPASAKADLTADYYELTKLAATQAVA